jgi:ribbon-helix-helix CopG family protein
MAKIRTTLTIDDRVMKAVRVRAARTGKGDSEVIEDAVRRSLGLDLFERMWERATLDEEAAMELALEAQHSDRPD